MGGVVGGKSERDRHARPFPLRKRLRYRFDNSLAKGPMALVAWLGVVIVVVVLVGASLWRFALDNAEGGFLEDVWDSVNRVLRASFFESGSGWPSRLAALAVALVGIFIGGSLIGLIATSLEQRVAALRKGRSPVLERDHTLLLGWSARLPMIVRELAVANESRTRATIVILASRPVEDMEEELRERVRDTRTTRVVCRSGDPTRPDDLNLVNIADARSIIVLGDAGGDASVVKTILAVKVLDPDFSRGKVVAEFAHPDYARSIRTLTGASVTTVNSDEIIAQVTAQACRQPGLSAVLTDLLDFGGDECYFAEVPELVGHTYAEALNAFESSSVVGCCRADGVVALNPPPQTVFAAGDRVIVIAEDDATVEFTGFRDVSAPPPAMSGAAVAPSVRVLVLGWSALGANVLRMLQQFHGPGSHLEVCLDRTLVEASAADEIRQIVPGAEVSFIGAGPDDLLALGGAKTFDQVIVLGYGAGVPAGDADARTLLTLLTLRKMWPSDATPAVRIIAQLLDQANVDLATTAGVDDLIVSDALVSLMLAQLSERSELQAVFDELFDAEGVVMELRPAAYLVPAEEIDFARVVAAGAAQGVSVLGWRVNHSGQVVINPPKNRRVRLDAADQVLLVGPRGA